MNIHNRPLPVSDTIKRVLPEFAYFDKPIKECSDQELISFYITFLNGADMNSDEDKAEYDAFWEEVPFRSKDFQDVVNYLNEVL
jgi:hypothetical protein